MSTDYPREESITEDPGGGSVTIKTTLSLRNFKRSLSRSRFYVTSLKESKELRLKSFSFKYQYHNIMYEYYIIATKVLLKSQIAKQIFF